MGRPRRDDPQPHPETLHREANETTLLLGLMLTAYRREYDLAGWGSTGAGLGVQGGQSDATQAALTSPDARASREACHQAAKALYRANVLLRSAVVAITTGEAQPDRPSRDAVITRSEFDQALHERRERELRR
jgi:hypothetical protein